MDGLTVDNILTGSELENLFVDNNDKPDSSEKEEPNQTEESENKETSTTEVNPNNLFVDDKPESVGSEGNHEEREDTSTNSEAASPKFFSSIAKAFVDEGIFPDLDDEVISKIEGPEDFRDLIEEKIKSELDERQKRIDDALNSGIEPGTIRYYENTLNYINNIDESLLTDEGEQGEAIRRSLIMQDLINRGYSKERAAKAAEKSFKNGDDIEDAREALKENKIFFEGQYNQLTEEAHKIQEQQMKERQELAENLKKSILTDKKFFGELEVDKVTRQKIYDNITKPVYKDPLTGVLFTAIQKYEMEHRTDFLKNLSLVFTLTDGFKNLDSLVKGKVKKEVSKGFKELEKTINNTSRTSNGSFKYVSAVDNDPESYLNGWNLDV